MNKDIPPSPGPLTGYRVLDLTRVLAGPICTQTLGDLGADVIKIEKPDHGDDTRLWGPPYLLDKTGAPTTESAYYLSANRNKKSAAIDISKKEGQDLILSLLESCDILVENFKTGGLDRYGLGYQQLSERFPRLIYCSITGFGHTGPLATEPGYDFLVQGMSGFMASTGAPNGHPTKAGVAIIDYITGLNAIIGILAALEARHKTGKGQHIDTALLDSGIALMTNLAQYALTSGLPPPRIGNAHTTIVPYQEFQTKDGYIIVTAGNDHQFQVLCHELGHPEWATDPHFSHNSARIQNRNTLIPLLQESLKTRRTQEWIDLFQKADIPSSPILNVQDAFNDPQAQARNMKIYMKHPFAADPIPLVGSPLKLSDTPISYRYAPPSLGLDTKDVLKTILHKTDEEIENLRGQGVIG